MVRLGKLYNASLYAVPQHCEKSCALLTYPTACLDARLTLGINNRNRRPVRAIQCICPPLYSGKVKVHLTMNEQGLSIRLNLNNKLCMSSYEEQASEIGVRKISELL